jgi:hypothetical protein
MSDGKNLGEEKKVASMDDTASYTSESLKEKSSAMEAEQSTREATQSPTPAASVKDEPLHLKKTMSAKDAQAEITKIMTSGEGIEYPTGIKLHLISLAVRTCSSRLSSMLIFTPFSWDIQLT